MEYIKRVIFEYHDGTKKVVKGKDLEYWSFVCMLHSDYLLPLASTDVLVQGFKGLLRGWVKREAANLPIFTLKGELENSDE